MKKILSGLLLLIFGINGSLSAQTGVRFGFKAGYSLANQYGINIPDIPYTVKTFYKHGIAAGAFAYFPITESFGVQQEFLYVTKGSRQDIKMNEMPVKIHTEYNMNYFELPFICRYKFVQLKKFGIYGSAGFALSILLNGDSRLDGSLDIGDGTLVPFTETTNLEGLDIWDYGFLYGAGIDFKLLNQDCFFEYRFNIGWNTLMMPTSTGQDPAPLRNQDYIFTLGIFL
jgi:hypothetical protein